MKLVIIPVKSTDFGIYKCVAKNSLGESEEIIKVHRKFLFIYFLLLIIRFNFHSIFNKCLDKTKKMDILYNQQQKGYLSTPINKSGKLAGKIFYILFMMLLLEVNGMDAQ